MKSAVIILFFVINFSSAQDFFISKEVVNDTVKLRSFLKKIIKSEIDNESKSKGTEISQRKIKQIIFLEDYRNSLSYIKEYRKKLAINNWEGNKMFSYEVFSLAKIISIKDHINFHDVLKTVIENKIDELEENLLINLKAEIDLDLNKLRENKKKSLQLIKNNDQVSLRVLNEFIESLLDLEVLTEVNSYALSYLEKKIDKVFDKKSYEVKTKNEISLSVTIIKKKNISTQLPAILMNNIYAGDRDILFCMRAAIRDYVGVVVNTRGKRNSKDENVPFEFESIDLYEIIDWISKQKWCDGRIGMLGGSYLGFSQWAALKQMHPALKTIVPQVAVGIGTMDYPMTNNVFMPYMLRWLEYVTNTNLINKEDFEDFKKWSELDNKYYNLGIKFKDLDSLNGKRNKIFQKWLMHPSQDSYWNSMIPYKDEFSKINIPILTTTGFWDNDQRGALYYYNEHLKYNRNAEHYLIIGPYNHKTAQSFPNNDLYGLRLDSVAKLNFVELNFNWFDYIFKDKPRPSIIKDRVNIQIVGTNEWRSYNSLKQISNKSLKFYLVGKQNTYSVFKKPRVFFSIKQVVDFKIRNEAKKFYSTGSDSTSIGVGRMAIESEILDRDIIINGKFSGNLNISINKKDLDIAIDLIQVNPKGEIIYLSDYIGRASFANDSSNRKLLKPNKITQIPIKNSSFVSKKIEKGSRLVVLFGVSKSKNWQINYGTGKDVSDESINDAIEPLEINWYNNSFIEIPIVK